ncbi:cytochrome P450 3A43-like [Haemaphysalis longicornis]
MLDAYYWAWVTFIVACCLYGIYRWVLRERRKCFDVFKGTGIPVPPLDSLISGNAGAFWKPNQIESLRRWLEQYGDVFGFFLGTVPVAVIKDVDMIKQIFNKDFSNFSARGHMLHLYELQPLVCDSIAVASGRPWKEARACMQQFFSLSKLKAVMPSLCHCEKEFIDALATYADNGAEVNISMLCERLTFDVISKTAFGIDTGVQKNPDHQLFQTAITVLPNILEEFAYHTCPPLSPAEMEVLAAHSMSVFVGGYDTTRLALTYWFYLMGKHPSIQEKMRKEALDAYKLEGDHVSVDGLTKLSYTNQVISETLRLYPPTITFTTRCAEKDYICGRYIIKKGISVMIPVYQLHHDPLLWVDPEKFDPDRFSPENKHLINPIAYQPFGLGPRMCIGYRLALLELASVTTQVLRHFRITLGPSQKPDLELQTYALLTMPKDKVWIKICPLIEEK